MDDGGCDSQVFSAPWASSPLDVSTPFTALAVAARPPTTVNPGELVLRTLLAQFASIAAKKIDHVTSQPLDRPLAKYLQLGEDVQFDQLLAALSAVSEHCLASVVRTILDWHARQVKADDSAAKFGTSDLSPVIGGRGRARDHERERRDLCVDFICCRVLIEVLKKLPVHPVPDVLVNYIVDMAFKKFKQRGSYNAGPNATNGVRIADLYAEMISVLSQCRFQFVRSRFKNELSQNPPNDTIINLICGLSLIKVKMYPVEELEDWFQFLKECGTLFLEAKLDKDVKHALASMFVEILVPVAAAVKFEVNLPVCKSFVDTLYPHAFELAKKARHSMAIFPLVTVLLSISQKTFFLTNWHYFLTMCLTNLKHRDAQMQRVALESVYRLLWVYMIRIKCESNTATQSRLRTIVDCLFPRGSRQVIPRDTPLHIFVKIVHFIAQEKRDFAMREIIFELLCVNQRSGKNLSPERMNIGLRAFLVICDSLEKKEGAPPMPSTVGVLPSGNTLRPKKHFLNTVLTDQVAKKMGIFGYYQSVRRALDSILRALDLQVGRQLVMTNPQLTNKDPGEIFTGDRKPKIDLYRTCVAAIPRCIPEGVSKTDLVDHLSRLTVHLDNELRGLAFSSLQTMVVEFPEWREDIIQGFVNFIAKDVPDSFPPILDSELRMLVQLLTQWKTAAAGAKAAKGSNDMPEMSSHRAPSGGAPFGATALHRVEGFALVMMCSTRSSTRKLAVIILKEVRNLLQVLGHFKVTNEDIVISVIEKAAPRVIQKCLSLLPDKARSHLPLASSIDLLWMAEQPSILCGLTAVSTSSGSVMTSDKQQVTASGLNLSASGSGTLLDLSSLGSCGDSPIDLWSTCLAGLFSADLLPRLCSLAVQCCWPSVFQRLMAVYSAIDPGFSINEPSSRPRSKKTPNSNDVCLWRNYLVTACCIVPSVPSADQEAAVSGGGLVASLEAALAEKLEPKTSPVTFTASELFRWMMPLIRCEITEVREAVVCALGTISPLVLGDLIEELQPLVREAIDKNKKHKHKKKHERDPLRLYLARIFSQLAESGCFQASSRGVFDQSGRLLSCHIDYIDSTRQYLLSENEKAGPALDQLRRYFSTFIAKLLTTVPQTSRANLLTNSMRYDLFFLFGSWCGRLSITTAEMMGATRIIRSKDLQPTALEAMSALLCCGPVFHSGALAAEGYLYTWIDNALECPDEKIQPLVRWTLEVLMIQNSNIPLLLNWVIDHCYTGSRSVADGCFHALAKAFYQNQDYPCDMVSVVNVALYMTADSSHRVRERAAQLLQLLDRRFFWYTADGSTLSGCLTATYSQSQQVLSQQLANAHPELTLPMFSEMCMRFESAPPRGQHFILQYMIPWLENIELKALPSWPSPLASFPRQSAVVVLQDSWRENVRAARGRSSEEATEMVLNNLFYITAKYGDSLSKELEEAWASIGKWSQNITVVLKYIIMLAGYSGSPELLHHAKKVVVFFGRTEPMVILGELMKELEKMDCLSATVEQTDIPPYYIVRPKQNDMGTPSSNVLKSSKTLSVTAHHSVGHLKREPKKTLDSVQEQRFKRYSAPPGLDGSDNPSFSPAVVDVSGSLPNYNSLEEHANGIQQVGTSVRQSVSQATLQAVSAVSGISDDMTDSVDSSPAQGDGVLVLSSCKDTDLSALSFANGQSSVSEPCVAGQMLSPSSPLPMPQGGGYYAPLTDFLLPSTTHSPPLYRCNFALMLLTELVVDRADIIWNIYLPQLLHVAFLGLDHVKPLVYEHCKRLLTNLVLVLVCEHDRGSAAHYMLASGLRSPSEESLSSLSGLRSIIELTADQSKVINSEEDTGSHFMSRNNSNRDSNSSAHHVEEHIELRARRLIEYITTRERRRPLWSYEEITSRVVSIKSAQHLEALLARVIDVFGNLPGISVADRWSKEALRWATCCSSRHYAGRSFQLCRALNLPLSWSMLCGVLGRLCDSAADSHTDVQGYVMEILLTLEAAVEVEVKDLASDGEELMSLRSAYQQQPVTKPSLAKQAAASSLSESALYQLSASPVLLDMTKLSGNGTAADGCTLSKVAEEDDDMLDRTRHFSAESSMQWELKKGVFVSPHQSLSRTKSDSMFNNVSTMKMSGQLGSLPLGDESSRRFQLSSIHENKELPGNQQVTTSADRVDLICRLFWISVALLESDYEHEFLYGLRLLGKCMDHISIDESSIHERLMTTLMDSGWPYFQGVQSLVLKGLTSANTFESTMHMLVRLTEHTRRSVIDMSQSTGIAINIISLLPYLVAHFEELDDLCHQCVTNIMKECQSDSSLTNLGKLFELYLTGQYGKTSNLWLHSICHYLHDAFPHIAVTCLPFLTEFLLHSDEVYTRPILLIISQFIQLSNHDQPSPSRSALNQQIIRIVSNFSMGNISLTCATELMDIFQLSVKSSAKILEPAVRSPEMTYTTELPGPTLEVQVELTRSGLVRSPIGASWSVDRKAGLELSVKSGQKSDPDTIAEATLSAIQEEAIVGWKKPHLCQQRVRDRLMRILHTCAPASGVAPSPSQVVFRSDPTRDELALMDHSSVESSEGWIESRESGDQLYGVLKEFDFLDELEQGGEDSDTMSIISTPWTNLRRHLSMEEMDDGNQRTSRTPGVYSATLSGLPDDDDVEYNKGNHLSRFGQSNLSKNLGAASTDYKDGSPGKTLLYSSSPISKAATSEAVRASLATNSLAAAAVHSVLKSASADNILSCSANELSTETDRLKSQWSASIESVHLTSQSSYGSLPMSCHGSPSPLAQSNSTSPVQDRASPTEVSSAAKRGREPSQSPELSPSSVDKEEYSVCQSSSEPSLTTYADQTQRLRSSPELRTDPALISSQTPSSNICIEGSVSSELPSQTEVEPSAANGEAPVSVMTESALDRTSRHIVDDELHSLKHRHLSSSPVRVSPDGMSLIRPVSPASLPGDVYRRCVSSVLPSMSMSHLQRATPPLRPVLSLPNVSSAAFCRSKSDSAMLDNDEEHPLSAAPSTASSALTSSWAYSPVGSSESPARVSVSPVGSSDSPAYVSVSPVAITASLSVSANSSSTSSGNEGTDTLRAGTVPLLQMSSQPMSGIERCSSTESLSATDSQPLSSEFINIPADEVDEVWRAHVSTVIVDSSAAAAVNSVFIFARLFTVLKRRFVKLTREACHHFHDSMSEVSSPLLESADLLQNRIECPFVYLDSEVLLTSQLLEHHKFCIVEMNENFLLYTTRRDTVLQRLEAIKVKLRRSGSLPSSDVLETPPPPETKDVSLARELYRLHFQLLLLFGSYHKLISVLHTARTFPNVLDLSDLLNERMGEIRSALNSCEWKTPEFEAHFATGPDPFMVSRAAALQSLEDCLLHRQPITALQYMRLYRRKWANDVFGVSEEDDFSALLTICAKALTKGRANCVMFGDTNVSLEATSQQLQRLNVQLLSVLKLLEA